jgi:hypothetical protein
MKRNRNSIRLTVATAAAAFVLGGCFGSEFGQEGLNGLAASIFASDVIGLGLIGVSGALLSDFEAEEEGSYAGVTNMFRVVGAMIPACAGVGIILWSEGRYGRFVRRRTALDDIDKLRGDTDEPLLSRERPSWMSVDAVEKYEVETRLAPKGMKVCYRI